MKRLFSRNMHEKQIWAAQQPNFAQRVKQYNSYVRNPNKHAIIWIKLLFPIHHCCILVIQLLLFQIVVHFHSWKRIPFNVWDLVLEFIPSCFCSCRISIPSFATWRVRILLLFEGFRAHFFAEEIKNQVQGHLKKIFKKNTKIFLI